MRLNVGVICLVATLGSIIGSLFTVCILLPNFDSSLLVSENFSFKAGKEKPLHLEISPKLLSEVLCKQQTKIASLEPRNLTSEAKNISLETKNIITLGLKDVSSVLFNKDVVQNSTSTKSVIQNMSKLSNVFILVKNESIPAIENISVKKEIENIPVKKEIENISFKKEIENIPVKKEIENFIMPVSKDSKILVSGASEAVALRIAAQCAAQGYKVVAVSEVSPSRWGCSFTHEKVTFLQGSWNDLDFLRSVFQLHGPFRFIFHVPWQKTDGVSLSHRNNLREGSMNLLRQAEAEIVSCFVFVRTDVQQGEQTLSAGSDDPVDLFEIALAKSVRLSFITFHLHNVYGPKLINNDVSKLLGKLLKENFGSEQRHFFPPLTFLADAIALIINSPHYYAAYNSTFDLVSTETTLAPDIRNAFATATSVQSVLLQFISDSVISNEKKDWAMRAVDKVNTIFGVRNKTDLVKGLKHTVDWLRSPHVICSQIPHLLRKVAVIVETRITPTLIYVLENFLKNLKDDWTLQILASEAIKVFITQSALEPKVASGKIILTPFLALFNQQTNINTLLKSTRFWDVVVGEKVLIFQVDSILCGNSKWKVDDFIEWDYVGAPWSHHAQLPGWLPLDGGNGGLSIRTKSKMLDCIRNVPLGDDPEDVVFSRCVSLVGGRIAPRSVSELFSVEGSYFIGAAGVHQPWLHSPSIGPRRDEFKRELEKFCPEYKRIGRYGLV